MTDTTTRRKRSWGQAGKSVLRVLVVGIVLVVGAVVWDYVSGDPNIANAGDCLAGRDANKIQVVACDDAKAAHRVLGKVDDVTQERFKDKDNDVCSPYSGTESAFWKGGAEKNHLGFVLCLAPAK